MKKIICITVLLIAVTMWCSVGFAQDTLDSEWREGIITGKTETTIEIDGKTYDITDYSVITDHNDDALDFYLLPTCCESVKFTVLGDDIEKIIFDTRAGW